MVNPKTPSQASFPVPPPIPGWPVVDAKGMATPAFAQFLQLLWAAIQGTGGIIDITTQNIFEESPSFSPDTVAGKEPIFAEMPESRSVPRDKTWLLAERSYVDLYKRVSNVEVMAALGTISPYKALMRLQAYTVATLPAGSAGDVAYVTDATAPTYLGALVGGGAVKTPVFFSGAAWVSF